MVDEHGRPCADDVEGELHVGGPFVARGYVGAPEETAATFGADGFVRTGDLAVRRAHGYEVVGRRGQTYSTNGYLVIAARLRTRLSRYKWPVAIVRSARLPETSSGKRDRHRLTTLAVDIARERAP